ncbi:hypothetical protein [Geodermatophilus poikilotrophus]|uniref:Uncharacterized protein n=1 Tax=Geodermatophilus poikilotrophus TaxID=1333667 RepID=A0A1I0GUG5_9ACTN|nr:hypothetical protein [Geodermatophilus poikilotrophus]SET73935.1 hypothetical protein SAMN04488546_3490 [Geodermatophilus poikilotrophus]
MTPPGHASGVRPWTVWTPLGVALAVVLFLATVGSVGVGFGVMTDCTNTYSCTSTGCPPCGTTSAWLTAGWIGQGVLLLVGSVLAVLAVRRRRLPAVRVAALALTPVSIALVVVTTALAVAAG